ncbi:MAG: hypothetical protein KAI79_07990 [Bacteroidales bacterium]|nr:hypothetical protein [Bacteroidales bacterium]
MEVKGIVTKSISDYVKANYSQQYVEWEDLLTPETVRILDKRRFLHQWHSIDTGVDLPNKALAQLFFDNDVNKAAFMSGRYSAEQSFNGVFRVLLVVISPNMLIQRASRLLGTFYKPSTTKIKKLAKKHIQMSVGMEVKSEIIEYRIAGWVQRAIEIANGSNVSVEIYKSFAKGDEQLVYDINWQ